MTTPLLLIVAAYLIGGIPFGYLLVRFTTGKDVRDLGSGNIGATNVLRTTGRGLGVLTLLLDIAKGYLAVWLMERATGGDIAWMSAAAFAVLMGHGFPIFLRFQGGKAVASFVGAFLCLAPIPLLSTIVLFVIVVAFSKYISLGSIIAAGMLPLAVWLVRRPEPHWSLLLVAIASGVFIIWRHRANIERLRAGTENVFRFGAR